jgi:putative copper export protein
MRKLLYLHLAIGLWLVFMGLIASGRPYLLLDVVLTQEELRDHFERDTTQALLLKGAGNDSVVMFVTAIVLLITSLIGMKLTRPQQNTLPS